jgi:hypothetical protein
VFFQIEEEPDPVLLAVLVDAAAQVLSDQSFEIKEMLHREDKGRPFLLLRLFRGQDIMAAAVALHYAHHPVHLPQLPRLHAADPA